MKEIESNIIGSLVFKDVCQLIELTKSGIARVVNSELTMLYWHIGGRIPCSLGFAIRVLNLIKYFIFL